MEELKQLLNQYLPESTVEHLIKIMDKDIPILIAGRQGPTGKTTVCNALQELGYNAMEPWEMEWMLENKKMSDDNFVGVTITLNKSVR